MRIAMSADEPAIRPAIRIESLSKTYAAKGTPPKLALDDVSFDVPRGQIFGLLGPNGAGKTTLLSIAAARLHPSRGMVDILDEILGAVDVFELRPRIGLTSAVLAAQIPDAESVRNCVVTAAYGVTGRWTESYDDADETQARELMAAWGIEHLAERRFGSLSEGERKRVLIARALMTDPELLLLDEPTTGLDPQARHLVWERLFRLKQRGVTLVLTTHYMDEAEQLCDRLVVMDGGVIVAEGSPAELIARYSTREVLELRFPPGAVVPGGSGVGVPLPGLDHHVGADRQAVPGEAVALVVLLLALMIGISGPGSFLLLASSMVAIGDPRPVAEALPTPWKRSAQPFAAAAGFSGK